MPLANGAGLGDGGDFRQALPADVSSCTGELLPAAVSEAQRLIRGQKQPAFGIGFISTSCILLFGFPGRR